jgi:hypothetical protein
MPYTYHVDWFSEHAPHWDAVLAGRGLGARGKRALFVGPFEGMCVEWMLKNVMTGPAPTAVVVASQQANATTCVAYRGKGVRVTRTLRGNLSALSRERPDAHIELLKPQHADALLALRGSKATFDFVYVDAESSRHAMEVATLAFPMLRRGGGVMVITNYTHGKLHDSACPRRGIDGFLDAYATELKVLRPAFHLFLERRAVAFALPFPCRSEYFDDGDKKENVKCRR